MVRRQTEQDLLDFHRLMTAPEAARMLHVSRTMIYLLIGSGELPTVHIRRALRFRSEDVQAYIRNRAKSTGKRPKGKR